MIRIPLCFFFFMILPFFSRAQDDLKTFESLLTDPKHYFCYRTDTPIVCDGILSENAWENAAWSEPFVDIEGKGKDLPFYDTRMKMLWDNEALYVAALLEEPHVWAYLDQRDDIVFRENDFEVFIDVNGSGRNYFEIEVNALNTIFDLMLPEPYRDGGRGQIAWDAHGLESCVHVEGTVNDGSDRDKQWALEIRIPFSTLALNDESLPGEEKLWRINFSRVEYKVSYHAGNYEKDVDPSTGKVYPEFNWVWSPQGVINMHYPERWGYLVFKDQKRKQDTPSFSVPIEDQLRKYLWLIYYKQKEYFKINDRYASRLEELKIRELAIKESPDTELFLTGGGEGFRVWLELPAGKGRLGLSDDGKYFEK